MAGFVLNDFRADAISASEEALRALGQGAVNSPTEAGISYCIPAPANAANVVRLLKLAIFAGIAIGGVLVLAGVGLYLFSYTIHLFAGLVRYLAIMISVIGFSLCFLPATLEQRLARSFLQRHVGDFWSDGSISPIFVSIEHAQTYSKFKVLAEDSAYMVLYRESRCIEIEGMRCRYMIYGPDVKSISLHPNGRTTMLTYDASGAELELAIVPRPSDSSKTMTSFGRDTFRNIQAVLATPTRVGKG